MNEAGHDEEMGRPPAEEQAVARRDTVAEESRQAQESIVEQGRVALAFRSMTDDIRNSKDQSPPPTHGEAPGAYAGAAGRGYGRLQALDLNMVGQRALSASSVEDDDDEESVEEEEAKEEMAIDPPPQVHLHLELDSSIPTLAVAKELGDSALSVHLPKAKSVRNIKELEEAQKKRKEGHQRKGLAYVAVGIVVLVMIVVIVVTIRLGKANELSMGPNGNSSSIPLEELPPMEHLETLYNNLPQKTRQALVDTTSPQAKSWHWLLDHPNITSFPQWRKQQLFALVTVFHALEGPKWRKVYRKSWLNTTTNECDWIKTNVAYLNQISLKYLQTDTINWNPCNEAGEIQSISLLFLGLADKDASPFVPPEIALFPSLRVLCLASSSIKASLSDMIPMETQQLTKLQALIFHHNNIHGAIPTALTMGQLTSLEYLMLGSNDLVGTIPTHIGRFPSLKHLGMAESMLEGTLPSELGLLTNLQDLWIYKQLMSGAIPSQLGELTHLNDLALFDNQLTGTIPTQMGLLRSLVFNQLENNNLSGTIPTELGLTPNVTDLLLENNFLQGPVPSQLGQLGHVHDFQLSGNQLTGTIPSQLGLLAPTVQRLRLDSNPMITGHIPSELWQLTGLQVLDLSNLEELSGTIPGEFCSLQGNESCSFVSNFEKVSSCSLEFNCTANLCGCSCPCFRFGA